MHFTQLGLVHARPDSMPAGKKKFDPRGGMHLVPRSRHIHQALVAAHELNNCHDGVGRWWRWLRLLMPFRKELPRVQSSFNFMMAFADSYLARWRATTLSPTLGAADHSEQFPPALSSSIFRPYSIVLIKFMGRVDWDHRNT